MADVPTTIDLDFKGYFLKGSALPEVSGVYCVYTCVHQDEKTVSIKKLVYVGESDDVRKRVSGHELFEEWKKQRASGEVLCYSAASLSPSSTRQRAEAAVIFRHKPVVNDEYTHSFPFHTATINVTGRAAKLVSSFIVRKDAAD
jgi:excinuclease UvrABC nuclease subunit